MSSSFAREKALEVLGEPDISATRSASGRPTRSRHSLWELAPKPLTHCLSTSQPRACSAHLIAAGLQMVTQETTKARHQPIGQIKYGVHDSIHLSQINTKTYVRHDVIQSNRINHFIHGRYRGSHEHTYTHQQHHNTHVAEEYTYGTHDTALYSCTGPPARTLRCLKSIGCSNRWTANHR